MPHILWRSSIFVIGMTGAIGSGKSLAGDFFREVGAKVMNADIEAKKVLSSAAVKEKLFNIFGQEVFEKDGSISTKKLAHLVFQDREKLKSLNQFIHPEVRKRFSAMLDRLKKGDIAVYDAPLLFESGFENNFDLIITISAIYATRLKRVKKSKGWSESEFLEREKSQLSLTEKEKKADLVIRNEGTPEELRKTVIFIYNYILRADNKGALV